MPTTHLIADLTRLLHAGREQELSQQLSRLPYSSIRTSDRHPLAILARKAGRPEIALKLLNQLIRPGKVPERPASDDEKSLYAACLLRVGAREEAKQLLSEIDDRISPRVNLFRGHAEVGIWEYEKALPFYHRFLFTPDLAPEDRLLAKLNLAACYTHLERFEEADPYLQALLSATDRSLLGSALEISSQRWIGLGEWNRAMEDLNRAQEQFAGSWRLEAFFVAKWRTVCEVLRQKPTAESLQKLSTIRTQAGSLKHWETVRDLDLIQSTHFEDACLFRHTLFGTPFEAFRLRMLQTNRVPVELGETYEWKLGGNRIVDGDELTVQSLLSPLEHRLLRLLTSDFYRPLRVASLHTGLYPQECFNPFSSPNRVHQAIFSLGATFKKHSIPLVIEHRDSGYQLSAKSGVIVSVPNPLREPSASPRLALLNKTFGRRSFQIGEAMSSIPLERRTLSRLLKRGVESGELICEGSGKNVSYKFVS